MATGSGSQLASRTWAVLIQRSPRPQPFRPPATQLQAGERKSGAGRPFTPPSRDRRLSVIQNTLVNGPVMAAGAAKGLYGRDALDVRFPLRGWTREGSRDRRRPGAGRRPRDRLRPVAGLLHPHPSVEPLGPARSARPEDLVRPGRSPALVSGRPREPVGRGAVRALARQGRRRLLLRGPDDRRPPALRPAPPVQLWLRRCLQEPCGR